MNGCLQTFSPPACQPKLARAERRARGSYYTPSEIVRLVVELTLGPIATAPRVLDPACGAGEFLIEAFRSLSERFDSRAARRAIFGTDTDADAISAACCRLTAIDRRFDAKNLQVADALDRRSPGATFDAIIGNPPYVNIRQLAKSLSRDEIDALRSQYHTARGNFDLYVLFIERALELLRPGGRCGLVIPNKWAALDYARPCRELLLSHTTIEHVIDLSHTRAFASASVYPHVLIFHKSPAPPGHATRIGAWDGVTRHRITQSSMSPVSCDLSPACDIESRVATRPLGDVSSLACGTAGYSAATIARRLIDGGNGSQRRHNVADFVTTGNIDRYAIRLGRVRYLNREYVRPRLPLNGQELTPAKRRLFASRKIVIAGMSRRLEAAWDERGLALGVQVFAAHHWKVDPFYLLGLLNSKLLSYLFATRFAAKRLGGGYLAINKGQLARLPVRFISDSDKADRRRQQELAHMAGPWQPAFDDEIDRLVYELYRLRDDEVARVEAHFTQPLARAA